MTSNGGKEIELSYSITELKQVSDILTYNNQSEMARKHLIAYATYKRQVFSFARGTEK